MDEIVFNLSCRSQDLKHSARLYEVMAARCTNLRHVVVFHLVQLGRNVAGRLGNMAMRSGCRGFTPELGKGFFPPDHGAQRRADEHLKHNRRGGATLYLVKLLLEAQSRGHKVLIVLPPVRSDYKAALGIDTRALFSELFEVIETFKIGGSIDILNAFDDPAFQDEHFGDFDHLLPGGDGTRLLSSMVNERLQQD